MGRIKTAFIKRITFKFQDKHKDILTSDFVKNKELLSEHTTVKSKKLRNVISGYLTRLTKNKDQEKPRQKVKEDFSKFY